MVITGRSWKPFVFTGAWVRIPSSPLIKTTCNLSGFNNALRHYNKESATGDVPKRLKGHPWKGCRSLTRREGSNPSISVSLSERRASDTTKCSLNCWKNFLKKLLKKCWQSKIDVVLWISCRSRNEKQRKRTLITKQWNNPENFKQIFNLVKQETLSKTKRMNLVIS